MKTTHGINKKNRTQPDDDFRRFLSYAASDSTIRKSSDALLLRCSDAEVGQDRAIHRQVEQPADARPLAALRVRFAQATRRLRRGRISSLRETKCLSHRIAAKVAPPAIGTKIAHPLATLLRKAPRVTRRGT